MKRRIIFLINPKSGTQEKNQLQKLISEKAKEQAVEFEFIPTNAAGNYEFLKDEIHQHKISDIVIVGGDGTANQVFGALHKEKVTFGIIPHGSGNGLANAAKIPKKLIDAIDLVFRGSAKKIDAFSLNNQFACMLCGLGFDAQVAHDFATKSRRGLLTYTQQSIINFFKAHPYQFEIKLPNFSFYTDAFFISVANSNQFGNDFTIAPQASLTDGLLDVVIVQKMNKAKLPFAILKQIRGNNKLQDLVEEISQKNIVYFQTPSLEIENLKLAPLHIDGEPKSTEQKFNIKILPKALNLIQP